MSPDKTYTREQFRKKMDVFIDDSWKELIEELRKRWKENELDTEYV